MTSRLSREDCTTVLVLKTFHLSSLLPLTQRISSKTITLLPLVAIDSLKRLVRHHLFFYIFKCIVTKDFLKIS